MKKPILLSISILLFLLSSCSNKKEYKYIEIVEEKQLLGSGTDTKEKDEKIIKAENDSIAYLDAYEDFCISVKVNKDMKEAMGSSAYLPLRFKLINEEGVNIANTIAIAGKEELEKEIESRIFSMKNTIKESVDKGKEERLQELKETIVIDSAAVQELKKYFKEKKDEFDPKGIVWHTPNSAPKYVNSNGIYCYFQSNDGIASNFRLRVQYHADDWLFFQKIQFSIDDKAYEYIPRDTETDSGNGGRIWEWSDEQIRSNDIELIEALANAKSAKMKLIGRQYHKIKTIKKEQIRDIKRALDYYKAMGGKL
jgi:hypothetical protein